METNYVYYKWICDTKQKNGSIKKWNGGILVKMNSSTKEVAESIFINLNEENQTFNELSYYYGHRLPFKHEIDDSDIQISEEEYEKIASKARELSELCKDCFSKEEIDRFNKRKH